MSVSPSGNAEELAPSPNTMRTPRTVREMSERVFAGLTHIQGSCKSMQHWELKDDQGIREIHVD